MGEALQRLAGLQTNLGNQRDTLYLSNFGSINIVDELKRLPGIADVTIFGARDYSMRVWINPEKMARYDARRVAKILKDPGIVRNRQKVRSAVGNARAFLKMVEAGESFDAFLWQFVGGAPKRNAGKTLRRVPAESGDRF